MIAKTRSDFYQLIDADGVFERDINNDQFENLEINRPITYYKITYGDLQRPDLISQKVYGTSSYWWMLMKFNDIDDVWNDLEIGTALKCPSKYDLDDYMAKVNW